MQTTFSIITIPMQVLAQNIAKGHSSASCDFASDLLAAGHGTLHQFEIWIGRHAWACEKQNVRNIAGPPRPLRHFMHPLSLKPMKALQVTRTFGVPPVSVEGMEHEACFAKQGAQG